AGADDRRGRQPSPGELSVIAGPLAQPGPVDRPGLALQYHPIDGAKFPERRQMDVADLGPEPLQRARHVLQRGRHFGMGRQVYLVKMSDKPDAQSADPTLQTQWAMASWT